MSKAAKKIFMNFNNFHVINSLRATSMKTPFGPDLEMTIQPPARFDLHRCRCTDVCSQIDYHYIKENNKFVLYMLDGDTVTLPATDLAAIPGSPAIELIWAL